MSDSYNRDLNNLKIPDLIVKEGIGADTLNTYNNTKAWKISSIQLKSTVMAAGVRLKIYIDNVLFENADLENGTDLFFVPEKDIIILPNEMVSIQITGAVTEIWELKLKQEFLQTH